MNNMKIILEFMPIQNEIGYVYKNITRSLKMSNHNYFAFVIFINARASINHSIDFIYSIDM